MSIKIRFKGQYDTGSRFARNLPIFGTTMRVYKKIHEPDGNCRFEMSDEYDIQKKIDTYAETCDMARIIARYNMTGEVMVPQVSVSGQYVDISGCPTNPQEALKWLDHVRSSFKSSGTSEKAPGAVSELSVEVPAGSGSDN